MIDSTYRFGMIAAVLLRLLYLIFQQVLGLTLLMSRVACLLMSMLAAAFARRARPLRGKPPSGVEVRIKQAVASVVSACRRTRQNPNQEHRLPPGHGRAAPTQTQVPGRNRQPPTGSGRSH